MALQWKKSGEGETAYSDSTRTAEDFPEAVIVHANAMIERHTETVSHLSRKTLDLAADISRDRLRESATPEDVITALDGYIEAKTRRTFAAKFTLYPSVSMVDQLQQRLEEAHASLLSTLERWRSAQVESLEKGEDVLDI
jgi:hypothetical protein